MPITDLKDESLVLSKLSVGFQYIGQIQKFRRGGRGWAGGSGTRSLVLEGGDRRAKSEYCLENGFSDIILPKFLQAVKHFHYSAGNCPGVSDCCLMLAPHYIIKT